MRERARACPYVTVRTTSPFRRLLPLPIPEHMDVATRPSRVWGAALIAATALLVVALAAVAVLLAGKDADVNARVDRLSGQITRLSGKVKSVNAKLIVLDRPGQTVDPHRVTALATQVSQIKDCLPEVQTEIGG